MKKQKIILALFALCLAPLVFAEVPVVDYSIDSTDNSTASTPVASGSPTLIQQNANNNQLPSEQEARASMGQQPTLVPTVAQSPQNKNIANPVVDTSNMSTQQRIKRLEQQVNYLNNSQANIEDLQQKLQKAQGDLEVQQHKTEQLEKQLNDFYSDLDQRISKTKTVSKGKAATNDASSNDSSDATNVATTTSTAKAPKPTPKKKSNVAPAAKKTTGITDANIDQSAVVSQDTADTTSTTPTKTVSKKDSTKDSATEQQSYQAAFDNLQNKQYDAATKQLKSYLANYPDGVYTGNAHYWLGEIYFQGKSYAKASTEFDSVVSKYPHSSKVPESMFKLAYIHDKEGKHAQAQSEYKELKKRFPKSGAAKLADEQLSINN